MLERILVIAGWILVYISIKNANAFVNQRKICRAIFKHHLHTLLFINPKNTEWEVDYSDMEPHHKTLLRLWDWGYKRILPPDKFEIIKDFMEG